MAVETHHLNLFPSQNRDFINFNDMNYNDMYNTQMGFVSKMGEPVAPLNQHVICEAMGSMKADSGLTCNVQVPRKRSRDNIQCLNTYNVSPKNAVPDFVAQDVFLQIHHHQSEVDRFISHHNEKLRMELMERQKRYSRLLISAIGEVMTKKMKEKDEEIQRIGKLNWALQEKVKNLSIENQLWKDLAHSNEAAANSLRINLEKVLAHVSDDHHATGGAAAEDAESCCGSSDFGGQDEEEDSQERTVRRKLADGTVESGCRIRMCRKCGVKESCVLVLPCRHLCLCTVCGSTLQSCPVCGANMNASVHVNMSWEQQ